MDTSRQIVLYYLFETDIETQDWRENLQLLKGENPYQRGWLLNSTRLDRLWTTKNMNWKRREALDGSILTRTEHSQVFKWDTKQPPPTNSLISKVMSIRFPWQMSELEASRHYSILNIYQDWDWKSIWWNTREWKLFYRCPPLWRARKPTKSYYSNCRETTETVMKLQLLQRNYSYYKNCRVTTVTAVTAEELQLLQ